MRKYILLGEIIGQKYNKKYYILLESEKSFDKLNYNNLSFCDFDYLIPFWDEKEVEEGLENLKLKRTKNEIKLNNPIKCTHVLYFFCKNKYRLNFEISKLIEIIKK